MLINACIIIIVPIDLNCYASPPPNGELLFTVPATSVAPALPDVVAAYTTQSDLPTTSSHSSSIQLGYHFYQ